MKNLFISSRKSSFVLLLGLMFCFTIANGKAEVFPSAAKADLRVSKIIPSGGLCAGSKNKIRVTITNHQPAGVKKKIPVILFVSMAGQTPKSYVGYVKTGIGPNDYNGRSVYFSNVYLGATGSVTFKAHVNPDAEILETVYNNNTRIKKFNVTKKCGTNSPPTNTKKSKVTFTTFKNGTWSGGNYQAVAGASITVKKGTQTVGSGTTGSNGKVTISNLPVGSVKIYVNKNGCSNISQTYMVPSYPGKKNIPLNCSN